MLDPRVGRWLSRDPLASKFPNISDYAFVMNSPIIYLDPDGNDVVYFDNEGTEIGRLKSNLRFETYVKVASKTKGAVHSELIPLVGVYVQAPMPGVIKGKEDVKYQKLDYQIAASTFIFNEKLKNKTDLPATKNHTSTSETDVPAIDVDLTKAIVAQESNIGSAGGNGTGEADPMQSNYPGDWEASKDVKTAVGLTKNQKMTPKTSVNAGLGILYLKGVRSNASGEHTTWRGDKEAVKRYNGGGTKGYADEVMKIKNSMKPATSENYVKPATVKKE